MKNLVEEFVKRAPKGFVLMLAIAGIMIDTCWFTVLGMTDSAVISFIGLFGIIVEVLAWKIFKPQLEDEDIVGGVVFAVAAVIISIPFIIVTAIIKIVRAIKDRKVTD